MSDRIKDVLFFTLSGAWVAFALTIMSGYGR